MTSEPNPIGQRDTDVAAAAQALTDRLHLAEAARSAASLGTAAARNRHAALVKQHESVTSALGSLSPDAAVEDVEVLAVRELALARLVAVAAVASASAAHAETEAADELRRAEFERDAPASRELRSYIRHHRVGPSASAALEATALARTGATPRVAPRAAVAPATPARAFIDPSAAQDARCAETLRSRLVDAEQEVRRTDGAPYAKRNRDNILAELEAISKRERLRNLAPSRAQVEDHPGT